MKKFRYFRGHHVVFGLALASLTALCIWWTVFFSRAITLEEQYALDGLRHQAAWKAIVLGHQETRPVIGPLSHQLAIIAVSSGRKGEQVWRLQPNYPWLAVSILDETLEKLSSRTARRKWMYQGESIFLFILVGNCIFMLFYLVRAEKRHTQRIEDFLSAVTHEMKTPLAGIQSLFQTYAAGRIPPEQAAKFGLMGWKETERLEHLIENALLSGRLRESRYPLQLEPLELQIFLQRFIEHRRLFLPDCPQALPLVWGSVETNLQVLADRQALGVVLENLVDNALKYCPDPASVQIGVHKTTEELEIAIKDEGSGFDPYKAVLLFDPYRREVDESERWHQGTGLGLALCKALVERMGGRIHAYSPGKGKGSTFSFTLPEVFS